MTQYGSETILPYNKEEQKGTQVKRMFDSIAETYDQLNHTLSFGIDKIWRRKGIAFLRPFSPKTILDIATGTGDLAISMYKKLRPDHIVGADISLGMMEVGRKKVAAAGYSEHISFEQQDCTALTYEENSFDAVTAAFGVRNFENIEQGISEMYRVLKPGGHIMILELSTPEHFPMRQLYQIYSKTVIPFIGRLLSKEKVAYNYLPASIKVVPQGKVMTDLLTRQGFKQARVRTFTFGIGAVNVIKFTKGLFGKLKLKGYNSDIIGFKQSIDPLLKETHRKALILGTGGASKAVFHGLKQLGVGATLVSRKPKEFCITYDEITPKTMEQYTVIVNTTPLGMFPNIDSCPDIPYDLLTPNHLLYDLLYNPDETLFMKKGKEKGAIVKNGLEMLLLQAFAAWEIWQK